MAFTFKQFSFCVFANMYKSYKSLSDGSFCANMEVQHFKLPKRFFAEAKVKNPNSRGKSVSTIQTLPTNFVQEEIFSFCKTLRPHFSSKYDLFSKVCRSRQEFYNYVHKHIDRLPKHDISSVFFAMYALISELNLFCIKNGCFQYVVEAIDCLENVVNKIPKLKKYVVKFERDFDTVKSSNKLEIQESILDTLVKNINASMTTDATEESGNEASGSSSRRDFETVSYSSIDEQSQPSTSRGVRGAESQALLENSEKLNIDSLDLKDETETFATSPLQRTICRICNSHNCKDNLAKFFKYLEINCST